MAARPFWAIFRVWRFWMLVIEYVVDFIISNIYSILIIQPISHPPRCLRNSLVWDIANMLTVIVICVGIRPTPYGVAF